MIPEIILATLLVMCVAQTIVDALRVTKHGGLTFWRLGRLGGSFYLATANRE